MILFVGNKIKLGGLVEVATTRLNEPVEFVDVNFDIKKQENDILLKSKNATHILYDCREYLNDGEIIIDIIKKIYRTNKAKVILIVETMSSKNEIVKCAVENQIKNFVNATSSLGEQKDQLEKILADFFENNETDEIKKIKETVNEENQTLKEFVQTAIDAKEREEERENTIIINKKDKGEVAIDLAKSIIKTVFSIIAILLIAVGIITLIYENTREELFKVFQAMYDSILSEIF